MRNQLRWQTWVTRLLLAGVLVLAAQFGLDLAIRSYAIRAGKTFFGTQVTTGNSSVSLMRHEVTLNDLQIADTHDPVKTILAADRCELHLNTRPLLFKQAVVSRGAITGLKFKLFNDDATQSGDENNAISGSNLFRDNTDAIATAWFSQLAQRLTQDDSSQFESVKQTNSFCTTWSEQSAALDARGNDLNQEAEQLQAAFEAAQANPLRGGTFLSALPQKLAALQKRFETLNADLDKLPDQLETERRAIVAARRHDEQITATHTKGETVETDAISDYLLRDTAAKPVSDLLTLLRSVREIVPAEHAKRHAAGRGEDILFIGCQPQPNVLIRALDLQGTAWIANRPVGFRGALTNYSTAPSLHSEPIHLRLQAIGPMPVEAQATIDRTSGVLRDAVVVDCQSLLIPALSLGRTDQVAMRLGPSTGSLSFSVTVDGDKLAGEVQLVQRDVHIQPTLGGTFADPILAAALEDSLGHIDALATRVTIGGTLAEPKCKLWSNLGPAVAEAMEHAVQHAGGQHTRSLMVQAGQRGDEQLTVIERQMSELQNRWKARIAATNTQLRTIAVDGSSEERLSKDRLGRRMPEGSLFR
jgi:uncharacterized protein (TIGR03545 family)